MQALQGAVNSNCSTIPPESQPTSKKKGTVFLHSSPVMERSFYYSSSFCTQGCGAFHQTMTLNCRTSDWEHNCCVFDWELSLHRRHCRTAINKINRADSQRGPSASLICKTHECIRLRFRLGMRENSVTIISSFSSSPNRGLDCYSQLNSRYMYILTTSAETSRIRALLLLCLYHRSL